MSAPRSTLLLMALLASLGLAQAADDPLQSPACLAARAQLDTAEAQAARERLPALRQQVAKDCLRASADPPRPARLARPAESVPSTIAPPPRVAAPSAFPSPTPSLAPVQPSQVTRCDAGGCWDNSGQRLNRSGNQLVNPQGQFCTQQGTVLVCP